MDSGILLATTKLYASHIAGGGIITQVLIYLLEHSTQTDHDQDIAETG